MYARVSLSRHTLSHNTPVRSQGQNLVRIDFDTSAGDETYTTLKSSLEMAKQLTKVLAEALICGGGDEGGAEERKGEGKPWRTIVALSRLGGFGRVYREIRRRNRCFLVRRCGGMLSRCGSFGQEDGRHNSSSSPGYRSHLLQSGWSPCTGMLGDLRDSLASPSNLSRPFPPCTTVVVDAAPTTPTAVAAVATAASTARTAPTTAAAAALRNVT